MLDTKFVPMLLSQLVVVGRYSMSTPQACCVAAKLVSDGQAGDLGIIRNSTYLLDLQARQNKFLWFEHPQ